LQRVVVASATDGALTFFIDGNILKMPKNIPIYPFEAVQHIPIQGCTESSLNTQIHKSPMSG
jgi:hypothetical protein